MERTFLPNHGYELKWSKTDTAFLLVTSYVIIFRKIQYGYLKLFFKINFVSGSCSYYNCCCCKKVGFPQMLGWEKPNGKFRDGRAKFSILRCMMVGQEEIDISFNMFRYKEMYFIFHHHQRLKQVPREVWGSLSKMMLKI